MVMLKRTDIYVFDVDDTLIDTKACIRAIDANGNVVFRAGTKVFNAPDSTSRLLTPGLRWDFSEFESLDQILIEPTRKPFNILRELAAKDPNHVYICTCRQKQYMLWKWLAMNDIHIPASNIMCYNAESGLSSADWKAEAVTKVAHLMNQGNESAYVHLWEDDTNFKEAILNSLSDSFIDCIDEPIN